MNPSKSELETQKEWGWGIIGTGGIAQKFVSDLSFVPNAKKCAVYSRTLTSGEAFATQFGVSKCYDDFEAFLAAPEVDIVYIATPHTAHMEQALSALKASKAVLIEKPIAMNAAQVREIEMASSNLSVFAMEALWSRFLPTIQRVKALLDTGEIGNVTHADASLYFERDYDPNHRLYNPALGGGVLHDLGVYPISVVSFLLGSPTLKSSSWTAAPNGVNLTADMKLTCGSTPVDISVGFGPERANTIDIYGTKGALRIDRHFLRGSSVTIWKGARKKLPAATGGFFTKVKNKIGLHGGKTEKFDFSGTGLHFQASAVQAALGQGLTSHPVMPLNQSAQVLNIIEEILSKPAVG